MTDAIPYTHWAYFAQRSLADACATELVRAVKDLRFVGALMNGTTEGRFLDHPSYDGLLAADFAGAAPPGPAGFVAIDFVAGVGLFTAGLPA